MAVLQLMLKSEEDGLHQIKKAYQETQTFRRRSPYSALYGVSQH